MPRIRDVCRTLRTSTDPQPVKVLVLSTGSGPEGWVQYVLEALDETFGDSDEVVLIAADDSVYKSLVALHHRLPPAALLGRIRETYGTEVETNDIPQVPGADGPIIIPVGRLRHLEEDLDILHSRILLNPVLGTTRFSGRPAPPRKWPARWMALGGDQEQSQAGYWPGNDKLPEPAFVAYTFPEPPGCRTAPIYPDAAFFHPDLAEFILPCEKVRLAANPDQLILDFFRSTYETGAILAGWDRAALERADDRTEVPTSQR